MCKSGCRYKNSLQIAGLALFWALAPSGWAQRNYDNVDDILNGQHSLLRIDDLVLTANSSGLLTEYQLNTSDGRIKSSDGVLFSRTPVQLQGPITTAHMFRNRGPVLIVSVSSSGSSRASLVLRSDKLNENVTATTVLNGTNPGEAVSGLTVADFNGDGLDDVAVETSTGLQICTARDPGVFDLQLRCGEMFAITTAIRATTSGDFRGDGRQRLAVAGLIAKSGRTAMWVLEADPKTLRITNVGRTETDMGLIRSLAIAAGNFSARSNPGHDQLAFGFVTNQGLVKVATVDFSNSSLNPEIRQIWNSDYILSVTRQTTELILKRARLNWFGQHDQLVFLVNNGASKQILTILTVNPDSLLPRRASWLFLKDVGISAFTLTDVVIGNFDRNKNAPGPNSATEHNPNLQIGLSYFRQNGRDGEVAIVNVNPGDDFSLAVNQKFSPPGFFQTNWASLNLAAADVQDRSIELGPPTKIVINNQGGPSVVAGVPPVHVDYVAPAGTSTPELLNLSAIEAGFSTKYKLESSSKEQSSTKTSDSYSFGLEESVNGELTFGNPKKSHVSAGLQFAAQQTFEDGVEKENVGTKFQGLDASVHTGTSDQVWYDESRLNIYSYPVLGKTVCPSDKPYNCAAGEKIPLVIQFSVIDKMTRADLAANLIEWYQPVWEYGNVLSYPASFSQLLQLYPDMKELADGSTFFTDNSKRTVTTTWSNGKSASESVSSARRFAEKGGVSVSGAVSVFSLAGLGLGLDVNVSGSQEFENLTTTVTDLNSSQGIEIDKPGNLREPLKYAYSITPHIFGRTRLPDAFDNPKREADAIHTWGPMQAAFVADPLLRGSGSWWKQAYGKAPDVAFNHPTRWVFTPASSDKGPLSNCVAGMCASLAASDPADPLQSEFHAMRGFFISSADFPGQGPQLETATAGDRISLQARVYNYSFVPMPAGSTVHVRFYVQPIDTHNKNLPLGPSRLIGVDKLAPIPPFDDTEGAPLNSVLARTNFDTKPYADQYLAFWVVTWMQDANGNLVKEPEGHGLAGIPGALTSLADVKAEQYSNNVGFYKWLFYVKRQRNLARASVLTQTAEPVLQADSRPSSESSQAAQLSSLSVSSGTKLALGQSAVVSTDLQAGANPVAGATVIFYDGDPKDGGRVFDMERVPYVKANDMLPVEVHFRPQSCGAHDLYAVVFAGTLFEKVSAPFALHVDCDAASQH